MSLSGEKLDESNLVDAFQSIPFKSIVLLEDVDAIFINRKNNTKSSISFSNLLNALDGIRSSEGRILFMTTNHKDKLDPALLRPGRADIHIELTFADTFQVKGLFENFYNGNTKLA